MNPDASFRVIRHQYLHPDLQAPALHIAGQNTARALGAIGYPALSFFKPLSSIWIYTPFCVGIHHTSIQFAYKAALETLQSGDIAADPNLNDEIKSQLAEKNFSRFHVNYRGDLVLHRKERRFSQWKGIALQEKERSPLLKKMSGILPSIQPQITYFHLEEDVQKQMDKVLYARQLRFRACMATVLVASTFGHIAIKYNLGRTHPLIKIHHISIGMAVHYFSSSIFRVGKHTHDLWVLIDQKRLDGIIKPKHQEKYPLSNLQELHMHVTTFGNIRYSAHDKFTFRDKHTFNAPYFSHKTSSLS